MQDIYYKGIFNSKSNVVSDLLLSIPDPSSSSHMIWGMLLNLGVSLWHLRTGVHCLRTSPQPPDVLIHPWIKCLSAGVNRSVLSGCLLSHGLEPSRLLCPWDSPGRNRDVGTHSILQGIFPTQGSSPHLSHCRQILFYLSHQGSLSLFTIWPFQFHSGHFKLSFLYSYFPLFQSLHLRSLDSPELNANISNSFKKIILDQLSSQPIYLHFKGCSRKNHWSSWNFLYSSRCFISIYVSNHILLL